MPTITMSAKKDQGHISSYTRKLRENVKAILENYGEMLKAAKVSEEDQQKAVAEVQVAHVEHEIEVRAANIVRAAEHLSKLVSDLKEFLILNDFSSVNDSCTQHISELTAAQAKNRAELEALYSQAAALAAGVAGQTVNPTAQPQSQELQQQSQPMQSQRTT